MREANRACLNRFAVNVDSSDMFACKMPKAHYAAIGHIDVNRGGRRRAPMDGSRFVRLIGYTGWADPWIFEDKVVVITQRGMVPVPSQRSKDLAAR